MSIERIPAVIDVLHRTPSLSQDDLKGMPTVVRRFFDAVGGNRPRDVFALSAIASLSGSMPNVWGRYAMSEYSPNLYIYVIAPPGSEKSVMNYSRELVRFIHDKKVEESQKQKKDWKSKVRQFEVMKRRRSRNGEGEEIPLVDPGPEPPDHRLIVPGDLSAAVLVRLLAATGEAILFETEADTLANTFKREWGQYDDKLRKAHGNEPVADLRLGGEREARKPRLSVVLSGTPDQLPAVVPSVENGLWSRFIYYGYAPDNPSEWRDVRPKPGLDISELLSRSQADVMALYDILESRAAPLQVTLSDEQWVQLNEVGEAIKNSLYSAFGYAGSSTAHRAMLHVFRIAMVLTIWNAYDSKHDLASSATIEADSASFGSAISIGQKVAEHAELLLSALTAQHG